MSNKLIVRKINMRGNISAIADQYIVNAKNEAKIRHEDGDTDDIIKVILDTDKISKNDTEQFAKYLAGLTLFETCSNVWHFIKQNISYKVDPLGYQYVKTPSRLWKDKVGDCKSFSIMTASILKNLKIPFSYRFVSYSSGSTFTHVYVVVPYRGTYIIIDCVMPQYNKEKDYKSKKDIKMTKIYQMSGTDNVKLLNLGDKDIADLTEAELELRIAKDRLLSFKHITEDMRGIGNLTAEKFQDSIDMLNDAIKAVDSKDPELEFELIAEDAISGQYSIAREIYGIGSQIGKSAKRQEKKKARQAKKQARKAVKAKVKAAGGSKKEQRQAVRQEVMKNGSKTAKFLLKAGQKIAKGAKAVAKVATAPQRLAIKGILELTLPKAAPFFLYLFINDPAIIAKLPEKVRTKRKKAEGIANFIVEVIGMKRAHFMGIVRNGIIKQFKKEPEAVLKDMMKGISGIGWIGTAVSALVAIISKIVSLFKKKGENVSEDDAPNFTEDFQDLTSSELEEITDAVTEQKDDIFTGEAESGSDGESSENSSTEGEAGGRTDGKSFWNTFGS